MISSSKKIVAVLTDLMFTVKIQDAARRTGLEVVFVKTQQEALALAKEHPAVVILDLNHASAQPLETIRAIKGAAETSNVKLVGFVSHVQIDLRQAAQDSGCDVVVARSTFSDKLPEILREYGKTAG